MDRLPTRYPKGLLQVLELEMNVQTIALSLTTRPRWYEQPDRQYSDRLHSVHLQHGHRQRGVDLDPDPGGRMPRTLVRPHLTPPSV
jgi:hypothetical protein